MQKLCDSAKHTHIHSGASQRSECSVINARGSDYDASCNVASCQLQVASETSKSSGSAASSSSSYWPCTQCASQQQQQLLLPPPTATLIFKNCVFMLIFTHSATVCISVWVCVTTKWPKLSIDYSMTSSAERSLPNSNKHTTLANWLKVACSCCCCCCCLCCCCCCWWSSLCISRIAISFWQALLIIIISRRPRFFSLLLTANITHTHRRLFVFICCRCRCSCCSAAAAADVV